MDRQRTTKIYFLANLLANLKKKNGISEDYKEGKEKKKKRKSRKKRRLTKFRFLSKAFRVG